MSPRKCNLKTYLQPVQFVAQVLLLVKKLLKTIGEYDVCVVQTAILFIEVLILILVVEYIVLFAILGRVVVVFLLIFPLSDGAMGIRVKYLLLLILGIYFLL